MYKKFFMVLFSFALIIQGCSIFKSNNLIKITKANSIIETTISTSKEKNTLVDWNAPSGGPYPTIDKNHLISIEASIDEQKIYIKQNNHTIYTMITSSGLDTEESNTTPRGTYHIEPERNEWFYSPKFNEGAKYWVSWKGHGNFLFHSVPMDQNKNVIKEEAEKLGKKSSHGCFRLTIPDAKWIFENIPEHTELIIK
ncbi:L,D-transpeptidase [Bacillus thuringiensis]|nr:L,D-transpeptidase [Bacillus thuringiensis]